MTAPHEQVISIHDISSGDVPSNYQNPCFGDPGFASIDGHRKPWHMVILDGMDATLIRQLIQRRLWDGRLPYGDSIELSCVPGTGHSCDGCGSAIMLYQRMNVRIDAHEWRELRFHQECVEIWNDERLKDAKAGPPYSHHERADRPRFRSA